jgi:hypothetical protein
VPEDLMTELKAADPARGRVLPAATREELLARIVAEPVPEPEPRGHSRRPARARPRTLLLAAILALAVSGVGIAAFDRFQTSEEVTRDYRHVTGEFRLPPGYAWPGANADAGGVYAGQRAAVTKAASDAICAWWHYWLAAHRRDDAGAAAEALRGHARVMRRAPRHPRGASEDLGGFDQSVFAAERRLEADARAGRPAAIRRSLSVNCESVRPPR